MVMLLYSNASILKGKGLSDVILAADIVDSITNDIWVDILHPILRVLGVEW